jgi:hypothetical protein
MLAGHCPRPAQRLAHAGLTREATRLEGSVPGGGARTARRGASCGPLLSSARSLQSTAAGAGVLGRNGAPVGLPTGSLAPKEGRLLGGGIRRTGDYGNFGWGCRE